ncbi:MAG: CRISPR-associated protein Csx19 [Chloroflexales bacterium]
MPREIKPIASSCTVEPVMLPTDLRAWLHARTTALGLRWLLAHTDSGVIWGELRNNELTLSSDAFPRPGLSLRSETLQQARLFGATGELLLWRGPDEQWHATTRRDGEGDAGEYFDEAYVLWGFKEEQPPRDGFRELREGAEGIIHAPPLQHTPSDKQRAHLTMRHYLQHDASGVIRIVAGRLLGLSEAEV